MIFDADLVRNGVKLILDGMGLDWEHDPNFKETPRRVTAAFSELTAGLYDDTNHTVQFPSKYDGIINFKAVSAIGLCPHHLLPIEYTIWFAYIPIGTVLGLSKVPRILKRLCARPVLQEDLTLDIQNYFVNELHPLGVAVVIAGIHGCMKYRGLKEVNTIYTSSLYGAFFDKPQAREEFFLLNDLKGVV